MSRRMVKTGSVHVAAKNLEYNRQPLCGQNNNVKTVRAQCALPNRVKFWRKVEVRGGNVPVQRRMDTIFTRAL